MKAKLNDVLLVHNVLGIVQLQFQFRDEEGQTCSWQMPFKLGSDLRETQQNLIDFARMLNQVERPPLSRPTSSDPQDS